MRSERPAAEAERPAVAGGGSAASAADGGGSTGALGAACSSGGDGAACARGAAHGGYGAARGDRRGIAMPRR